MFILRREQKTKFASGLWLLMLLDELALFFFSFHIDSSKVDDRDVVFLLMSETFNVRKLSFT